MILTPLAPDLMAAVWTGDLAATKRWTQAHENALLARAALADGDGRSLSGEEQAAALSADEALVAAAQLNHGDIARVLLAAGASPRHLDAKAWGWAIQSDNAPLADSISDALFSAQGSAISLQSKAFDWSKETIARGLLEALGWDPVEMAAQSSSLAVLSSWRDKGLISSFPWGNLSRALISSCKQKNGALVSFFLDLGIDLWDHRHSKKTRILTICDAIDAALANPDPSALAALLRPDRAEHLGDVSLYMALAKANAISPLRIEALETIAKAIPWSSVSAQSDLNHELVNCAGSARKAPSLRIMLQHGAPPDGIRWRALALAPQTAPPKKHEGTRPWALMQSNIPLFAALIGGASEAISALMEHGADPGFDAEPDSPISFARKIPSSNASHEAAQILIALAEQRELRAISRLGEPSETPTRKPLSL